MSSKKSSKGGFPWKTGCFFLLLSIGAIVAYDIQKNGSFEGNGFFTIMKFKFVKHKANKSVFISATNTARFFKDSGVNAFVQKAWVSTKLYADKGRGYLEATSPEYYKAVVDFSTPYVNLAGDVYLVVRNTYTKLYINVSNYIVTTKPLIQDAVSSFFFKQFQVNSYY